MAYLLDADTFIRAKRMHYGFDICPAYWDWLAGAHAKGRVFSVERVGEELRAGADELSEWARKMGGEFFRAPDATTPPALEEVAKWATSLHYSEGAIRTFLQAADYYLVAQALAGQHVAVTHETSSQAANMIKIPDACASLGVKCLRPHEMLRNEQARFVLGEPV